MDLRDPLIEASAMQRAAMLRIGQRVEYRGRWGRGHAQPGTITGIGEVREGTPYAERVYDVDLDTGARHWGYPEQFTAIGEGVDA